MSFNLFVLVQLPDGSFAECPIAHTPRRMQGFSTRKQALTTVKCGNETMAKEWSEKILPSKIVIRPEKS